MFRSDPCIVLTRDAATKIATAESTSGHLSLRLAPSENALIIDVVEMTKGQRYRVDIPSEYTALQWGDSRRTAQWMRQPNEGINVLHLLMARRPAHTLPFADFRARVPGVEDPGHKTGIFVTYEPDLVDELRQAGVQEFAGWAVERGGVRPIHIEVEPHTVGLAQLAGTWPVEALANDSVMVVGTGSIGSAAAEALAAFGVGTVDLVDPDRFLWHNIVRHTLGPESVGRYKVDALKSKLEGAWPTQQFVAHRRDVVADAHVMRALIPRTDLVLCAADGIAPRRVISHLARRAKKPAVLACVLDIGAIGEVVRLRPAPNFGCLLCLRADLEARGAMDAEADQELGYGTGRIHQPMTAVPPDLHLVGTLAAKVAVATLLESRHGDHTQQLPGEHAVMGLRPRGDLVAPFDSAASGQISWHPVPAPRPGCPTCEPQ